MYIFSIVFLTYLIAWIIKYIILGHSELREKGENNNSIKKKIGNSVKSNLNIILCVGESYSTYKKKK